MTKSLALLRVATLNLIVMENNKQKTLLLAVPYFPPHPGGLERYAEAIALRLVKNFGWRVIIVTSSDNGKDSKQTQDGLTIYRFKTLVKLSNTPFSPDWIVKMRRVISEENPDIINSHAPVPGMADVAALIAGKIPFVTTYHSGSMEKGGGAINIVLGAYEKFVLPLIFKKARRIISSSEFLRTGFLKNYQSKITTVSPGVATNFFTPPKKEQKDPVILFVGDYSKAARYKGIDYLIDALAILKKKVPDATLNVVGGSDDLDFYQNKCAELSITGSVNFLGRMGEERVHQFQKTRVFALATSNDNFPMVIAEALSCGVPVVSTPIGNIPMMVENGKNGFLVPIKNAQALAAALEKILTDSALHQSLSHNARAKAVNELSWDSRVASTDELFTKLINDTSSKIYQISAYYPPHLGGVERVVEKLSKELINRGHQVTVLTTDSAGNGKIVPETHVKFLRSFEFAHTPFAPTLLWELLKIRKNDLAHLHVAQAYFPEAVWLTSQIKGFPYVAHFHLDVPASGPLGFIFNIYKKTLLGVVLRSAKKVIVFSEPQARAVATLYRVSPKNVQIIPNGVSEDFFVTRHPNKIPRILYVGRLVRAQKHIERLIEAAQFLRHNVEIDLVGGGEDHRELESLARSINLSNIHFHGAKSGNELIEFYRSSDIFILPSDAEGMPLALLEAMAAGLPIIGSSAPGIRELIHDCGILVDPSAKNFAAAIDQLLDNNDLAQSLSRKSIAKARNLSWGVLTDQFEDLYQKVQDANH